MNKRFIGRILQESKPYDFLLLLVSAIVGFVLSRFDDSNITCICAVIIIAMFILFWLKYNISEINSDYMKMIDREFENEHWYDVFYLAFPICATLRRMGKYHQAVKIALKINKVLTKINPQKIDRDWIEIKYTDINRLQERLMINDLGYSYFMLKDIKKAKQFVYKGISIAKDYNIDYAELKGYTMLLQMLLVDTFNRFFNENEEHEIYNKYKEQFNLYWGELNGEFPKPEAANYVSYLKSLEIETQYKLKRREFDEREFIAVMGKIAEGYKLKKLNDKYYDCKKRILEIKLKNQDLNDDGSAEASFYEIIDGAFDANIGLTSVQYIKYVTICLEYYVIEAAKNNDLKRNKKEIEEHKERAAEYIKRVEKELWYVEDPCVSRFKKAKKEFKKSI